jgi:segregation and condensation protein B
MKQKQPAKVQRPSPERLPAVLESLLFVAEEPIEIGVLAKAVNAPRDLVETTLEEMSEHRNGRGVFIQRLGDKVQLATVPEAAPYIEHFIEYEQGRLSRAALETLAIIAYRQPVTRATIESIRGVNSDQSVATLAARGLVEESGRAPGPGRPVLFCTTVRFLEYFGLQRPDEMPQLPPLEDSFGITDLDVETELPDGAPTDDEVPALDGEATGQDVDAPEPDGDADAHARTVALDA